MLKIALCSPRVSKTQTYAQMTIGLDFLSRIVKRKYKDNVEFYTVETKDIVKLSALDVDFLWVSLTGSDAALDYAKAVKFKKPKPYTVLGGPGMLFPAVFRDMANAICMGRGEDAMIRLIEGDTSGMMLRNSTLEDNSVKIFQTSLISQGQQAVGCTFRCGFCSYSWMHTYACAKASETNMFLSNVLGSKRKAPMMELMLKDLHFNMLTTSPFRRPISGLDMLTLEDMTLTRKPCSFALLKSVIRRMNKESREKYYFPGFYNARLFTVTAYPWNEPVCDFSLLEDAMKEGDFPEGIIVKFVISLNHFIPQITTPLECCAVNLNSVREFVQTYEEPRWKDGCACFHLEKLTAPSPLQAVQQAILQRSSSPDVVPDVCSKGYMELADKYPDLVGWQGCKPAPWIQRNNDNSQRVSKFYQDLYRLTSLRPPIPTGYKPFKSNPDLFDVPVCDFGVSIDSNTPRKVRKKLFNSL